MKYSEPHIHPRNFASGYGSLIVWLAICWGTAIVGSLLTVPSIPTWYASLEKPPWTPPNAVFGPVWTVLFTLMAISTWRVWVIETGPSRFAVGVFLVHLCFNLAWSGLFFALQSPGWAFLDIVSLLITLLLTMVLYARLDRLAGLLLVPYLAWVSFAACLNLAIWKLNS